MRLGLIADTHLAGPEERLPELVAVAFAGCDLILHAGDFDHVCVLDELERIAPVVAARGYRDPTSAHGRRIAEAQRTVIAGIAFGLVHDIAHPAYGIRTEGSEARLRLPAEPLHQALARRFKGPVDIVVFGDTHVATVLYEDGVLLINPGSPTYPHFPGARSRKGTIGTLETGPEGVRARIIELVPGLPVLQEMVVQFGGKTQRLDRRRGPARYQSQGEREAPSL